jgi:hypothetical protein
MNEQDMLDFIKALSHTDRLKIVGLLTQKSMQAAEIAEAMNLPLQETVKHLFHLEQGGIVLRSMDGIYSLDQKGLETLAKQQLEGTHPAYIPDSMMKEDARKVLAGCLKADGTIIQIPAQPGRRKVILEYVLQAFEPGKVYKERDVNLLLARFHKDTASLRRYLIDEGMLARERDGSKYWRP